MNGATATERITLYQRGIWQTWAVALLPLLYWWLWLHDWRQPLTWQGIGKLALYLGIASLLGLGLKQLLNPEPLAVEVDYRAGLVTRYQPGIRWKTTLPLADVRCQLSRQASHSGHTHFLVVSSPQGQAWVIQQSPWWPLARLKRLRELLTFEVP